MQVISKLILQVVEGVLNIQAERNLLADNLPPGHPHRLVKLNGREFTSIISIFLARLKQSWSDEDITKLDTQHSDFLFAYRHEPMLRNALERCDGQVSFEDCWKIVSDETGKFNILRDFCGGIATIFPNTGTVESDFSIPGWERDEYRQSLTDLSLEEIMQCKQFKLLADLTCSIK